jgi:hypothetical protein
MNEFTKRNKAYARPLYGAAFTKIPRRQTHPGKMMKPVFSFPFLLLLLPIASPAVISLEGKIAANHYICMAPCFPSRSLSCAGVWGGGLVVRVRNPISS